jgi:type IV pilus assembly protein PilA
MSDITLNASDDDAGERNHPQSQTRTGGLAVMSRKFPRPQGFTLLELMIVVAVIAILALIALPSFIGRTVRQQIQEALPLADVAKPPLAAVWSASLPWPADNAAAGLPAADKIVGNYVSAVQLDHGAIHLVFGNNAHAKLKGRTLTLRAAVVEDTHLVPIAWVCGNAKVPDKMTAQGPNKTDVDPALLPLGCR